MENLDVREIEYFKGIDCDHVLDSLTKVICREYIIDIARKLLEEKKPFTLLIIDLDNFKQINDSFGHLTGDFILKSVSENLLRVLQRTAYIGRYGGDEFLLLIPGVTDYDDVHKYLENIYGKDKVFRKYYNDGTRDIYLTATGGCASYPQDGTTFDELFGKADKALYRGKTKGRNCFIIYVESKHANIVIHEKVHGSLIEKFRSVKRIFDIYKSSDDKMKHLVDFLYTELHCSAAYFLFPDKRYITNYYSDIRTTHLLVEPHLELVLNGDTLFYETPLTKYKQLDPILSRYVANNSIQSFIVSKIKMGDYQYGYIVLNEKSITRVWQEAEIAMVMYASEAIELEYKSYKSK